MIKFFERVGIAVLIFVVFYLVHLGGALLSERSDLDVLLGFIIYAAVIVALIGILEHLYHKYKKGGK
jgi:Na+-transporting NADH:ubiquinone oxidoreductase subunit NqrE